ncbi:actin [Echinococcus multilocularis]|uniref:Actin n=1 Tax=Echinococcus multilocularis TaxID=6211 RepID=A0A068XWU7_ECHMU|nr:actin [Echinococcus multilocularis]
MANSVGAANPGTDEGIIPVVVDSGSRSCRVGFAGDDSPRVIQAVTKVCGKIDMVPIQRGHVVDWDRLELLWREALTHKDVRYVDSPLLFTEAPMAPKFDRERTTQIAFESFNAPAAYLSNQAALALYAVGKTTGLVLDIGHGVTHTIPVVEGNNIYPGVFSIDVAGEDLTEYLQKLTGRRDYCELLKEKLCEVSLTPEKMEYSPIMKYTLPDGEEIAMGGERFQCPEVLFKPSLLEKEARCLAVQEAVYHSVQRCDRDTRREMYANIVLAGGSSMFRNLKTRLTREISMIAQSSFKVNVSAPPEGGKYSSWLGGSIFASLSTFQKMWITKQEYNEWGPSIVHRKCN